MALLNLALRRGGIAGLTVVFRRWKREALLEASDDDIALDNEHLVQDPTTALRILLGQGLQPGSQLGVVTALRRAPALAAASHPTPPYHQA